MFENLNLSNLTTLLQQPNTTSDVLIFVIFTTIFWAIASLILVQFSPTKYRVFKREMLLFFITINVGLIFVGVILTLIMLFFGLAWATHRKSQPNFASLNFEEYIDEFPLVYSQFQEGLLTVEGRHSKKISSDAKIKSLRILYDSNAQGNIAKIKNFLADSSDETRLYAFALIASFEKKLNTQINELQSKIKRTKDSNEKKRYYYELAYTYWQFIFHGVASDKLAGFYTKKIENTLKYIDNQPNAFILLGKINIFNKKYDEAKDNFQKAIELGVPKETLYPFLAEIQFAKKQYNSVSKYLSNDLFHIDIRLKPVAKMWTKS